MLSVLLLVWLSCVILTIKFMFIQFVVIPKLGDKNKFRLWWERNITSPIDFEK